jgi:hypothetical protein
MWPMRFTWTIAAQWQQRGQEFAGVVFCHQLGPGFGQMIEDLEFVAFCAEDGEVHNRVIYLPLS